MLRKDKSYKSNLDILDKKIKLVQSNKKHLNPVVRAFDDDCDIDLIYQTNEESFYKLLEDHKKFKFFTRDIIIITNNFQDKDRINKIFENSEVKVVMDDTLDNVNFSGKTVLIQHPDRFIFGIYRKDLERIYLEAECTLCFVHEFSATIEIEIIELFMMLDSGFIGKILTFIFKYLSKNNIFKKEVVAARDESYDVIREKIKKAEKLGIDVNLSYLNT